jgi:hypothetical protein
LGGATSAAYQASTSKGTAADRSNSNVGATISRKIHIASIENRCLAPNNLDLSKYLNPELVAAARDVATSMGTIKGGYFASATNITIRERVQELLRYGDMLPYSWTISHYYNYIISLHFSSSSTMSTSDASAAMAKAANHDVVIFGGSSTAEIQKAFSKQYGSSDDSSSLRIDIETSGRCPWYAAQDMHTSNADPAPTAPPTKSTRQLSTFRARSAEGLQKNGHKQEFRRTLGEKSSIFDIGGKSIFDEGGEEEAETAAGDEGGEEEAEEEVPGNAKDSASSAKENTLEQSEGENGKGNAKAQEEDKGEEDKKKEEEKDKKGPLQMMQDLHAMQIPYAALPQITPLSTVSTTSGLYSQVQGMSPANSGTINPASFDTTGDLQYQGWENCNTDNFRDWGGIMPLPAEGSMTALVERLGLGIQAEVKIANAEYPLVSHSSGWYGWTDSGGQIPDWRKYAEGNISKYDNGNFRNGRIQFMTCTQNPEATYSYEICTQYKGDTAGTTNVSNFQCQYNKIWMDIGVNDKSTWNVGDDNTGSGYGNGWVLGGDTNGWVCPKTSCFSANYKKDGQTNWCELPSPKPYSVLQFCNDRGGQDPLVVYNSDAPAKMLNLPYLRANSEEVYMLPTTVVFCGYPVPLKTASPTKFPTKAPTKYPTKYPTKFPTKTPTAYPTAFPTAYPTKFPTKAPTKAPTKVPTKTPTKVPTKVPTKAPTAYPTKYPTKFPTKAPTAYPTAYPTAFPTAYPTKYPTLKSVWCCEMKTTNSCGPKKSSCPQCVSGLSVTAAQLACRGDCKWDLATTTCKQYYPNRSRS